MKTPTPQSGFLSEIQRSADRNVFVMMRYRSEKHFAEIETSIRDALLRYGLIARLAKDGSVVDDLWENITYYMRFCRFGIAVFEDIDEREFNPNISLELGYMYAMNKRCLLLKEKRMPRLPVDICGRIYRDFDALDILESIQEQVAEWCSRDLGLSLRGRAGVTATAPLEVAFDNATEDPDFRTWGRYCTTGFFTERIRIRYDVPPSDGGRNTPVLDLVAEGTESVGINKDFSQIRGRIRFVYKAFSSGAANPNLLFCMIPMKGQPVELLEVGANMMDEPGNAYSPYRVRYFVPESHIGDDQWHEGIIDFDFSDTPTAEYSIFSPRLNEGCPRPGPGHMLVRDIQLFAHEGDLSGPTTASNATS